MKYLIFSINILYFFNSICANNNLLLSANNINLLLIKHINEKKNQNILSRRWLYIQSAKSSNFVELNEVKKNRDFFIKILKDHINYLENQKRTRNRKFYLNKISLGCFLFATILGAGKEVFDLKEQFKNSIYIAKSIRYYTDFVVLPPLITFMIYSLFKSSQLILSGFGHIKSIPYKLERDRRILQELELSSSRN
ncbi:hypothetical protein J120_02095 [candidate division TM6 bacterium JCVI TM6SC1]|uniref:Uncharacterized protein n=1 Tax=candidate division TM6 bacterium JCVI TM6SC1 TaxID=1306947 RepID=A0A0D2JN02_9BACT|nr:hypothetical protein J120_02095 [candidate division TM6 bacterium JCVI TM6SC1]